MKAPSASDTIGLNESFPVDRSPQRICRMLFVGAVRELPETPLRIIVAVRNSLAP
jgi:hypothetical protein